MEEENEVRYRVRSNSGIIEDNTFIEFGDLDGFIAIQLSDTIMDTYYDLVGVEDGDDPLDEVCSLVASGLSSAFHRLLLIEGKASFNASTGSICRGFIQPEDMFVTLIRERI